MKEYIGKWIRKKSSTTVYYILGVIGGEVISIIKDNAWSSNIAIYIRDVKSFDDVIVENDISNNFDEKKVIERIFIDAAFIW